MIRTGSIAVLAICAQIGAAGRVTGAEASITSQQIQAGESFEVVVTAQVEGDASDLPWPEVTLPDGIVAGSRNRSQESQTQISWVNGAFQKTNTTVVRFHLELKTSKPGTFPLGPVTFQGRDLGSGRIVVGTAPTPASADIRTSTIVSSRKVWVGQQIPFTWRLESGRPLQVTSFPDLRSTLGQGFFTAAPDSQTPAKVVQDAQGRSIARMDWKGSIFPLRAGRQNLPSTQLGWKVIEGGSVDPFEAMMRGEDPFEAMRRVPKVREGVSRTEVVPLEIRSVPEAGRPAAFQGGVGQFRLEASLDGNQPTVGKSVTLVLRLSGNGQPQASGLPLWASPDSVEAYPPQDTWKSNWKDGVLQTTLERKIVLVPRSSGSIPLDSVRFAWFDPISASFQKAAIGLPSLNVTAPSAVARPESAVDSLRGKAPVTSRSDRAWILFGKVSAVVWSLLLIGIGSWLVLRIVRERLSTRSRKLRAFRETARRVEGVLKRQNPPPGELRNLLVAGMAHVEGDDSKGWTANEVRENLLARWNPEAAEDFATLLRELEASEFAGLPVPDLGARSRAALALLERTLADS